LTLTYLPNSSLGAVPPALPWQILL
jgi:hypothetical protein